MYPTVHENTSPAVCRKKNSLLHSVLIIAGLLLAALLLGGCKVGSLVRYRNADKYETGNFKYKASDVSKVEINWISGDIEVRQGRGSTLSAEESGGSLKESQKLRWRLDGDRLVLQYCKSGYRGRIPSKAKRLTIEVPEGGEQSALDAPRAGTIDMTVLSYETMCALHEEWKAYSMPYLFLTREDYWDAMDSDTTRALYDLTAPEGIVGWAVQQNDVSMP